MITLKIYMVTVNNEDSTSIIIYSSTYFCCRIFPSVKYTVSSYHGTEVVVFQI